MFISRKKAKGEFYHYVFMYDKTSYSGIKTVYRLGKKEEAINQLSAWGESANKIPVELLDLGLKLESLEQWRKKMEVYDVSCKK